MKIKKLLLPVFAIAFLLGSCTKDDIEPNKPTPGEETGEEEEEEEVANLEVENFIWNGLNNVYLYQSDVKELGDTYFANEEAKNTFLKKFDTPEDAFYELLSNRDRFSFIVDDYPSLENSFAGINTTNGMQTSLYLYSGNKVFGIVTYVLPNTSAQEQGIKRGDIFTSIDGVDMDQNNYQDLLARDTYEIDINYLNGNNITPTGTSVTLTKKEYSINPLYITKALEVGGSKVGYLMYNSFTDTYDAALNAAFGEFKATGIQELVLDLRYNGGGNVATAVGLAGMITGQFTGEIFLKEQWNERYEQVWEPESYLYRFSDKIILNRFTENETEEMLNSLGLNRVYVLTTNRSASASELIINGLEPYIDVIQIGDVTTGKFEASITLYDSPNFSRTGANPNHTYAIQPLVFKSSNAEGKTDYVDGLTPDLEVLEDLANLGTLGDPEEPLLKAALDHISGKTQDQKHRAEAFQRSTRFKFVGAPEMNDPTYQKMYIEELPSQREL